MTILVLGASSVIGAEIAAAFAPGRRLLLAGRDRPRLDEAAARCLRAGAAEAVALPCDLSEGAGEIARALGDRTPDLIINAASATSRLRDSAIASGSLAHCVAVDLLAPVALIQTCLARARGPLAVIFVSSILAVTRSPNRMIYSSLKNLQERALWSLAAADPRLRLQIVRVARVIDPDRHGSAAAALARAVRRAFEDRRALLTFGVQGRLMAGLYYVQPLLFAAAVRLFRLWHKLRASSHTQAAGPARQRKEIPCKL